MKNRALWNSKKLVERKLIPSRFPSSSLMKRRPKLSKPKLLKPIKVRKRNKKRKRRSTWTTLIR